MKSPFKIIDLFAGPGGLGEGFSGYKTKSGDSPFKIALSVEMEQSAHKTLALRAFYRQFPESEVPEEYYQYLAGNMGKSPEDELYKIPHLRSYANKAKDEARNLTLGTDNREIFKSIKKALGKNTRNWVLIGGPPCQAYSIVGRSRNKGIDGYIAEEDKRNFLYKEYLRVISKFQPAVFVMENVKGMLSAKIAGELIFKQIRNDLRCPSKALKNSDARVEYEILPLVEPEQTDLFTLDKINPKDYLIMSENYGIPQTRHRVILLGVRSDILKNWNNNFINKTTPPITRTIIQDLPKLRSGLSKETDTCENWVSEILTKSEKLLSQTNKLGLSDVSGCIDQSLERISRADLHRGVNWSTEKCSGMSKKLDRKFRNWFIDKTGWRGVVNHETKSHIQADLHRYLFSACYSRVKNGEIPRTKDFPPMLRADHANWETGHFSDRFRTQASNQVAKTITSHIAKDGHYYIHYDPAQCRSLTVREAARIQTFPDNYFFVGTRTQQYIQVGNAVPPYLARQIADIVFSLL
ncbi:DNA cytosine methyltransferase [Thiohalophilus sp.]|uniref:DNA cytosine methyltransferase n=1 Tax=Thiohalophilus sp. TaxID=3028392 RepID=UPI002ACE2CCA|nr:DNA cytosine methyltransferase [Thiohalophilus sp.]MDZ7803622.1 DNA cytosine methyltransferase [Thiohalophilus sp.]